MYRYASVLAAVGLLVLSDPTHLIAADDPSKQGAAESDAEKALKERVEKLSAIATKVPNTVITCHTSDLKCDPGEIYISAASVSTILIDTKPNANKKKLTVQLSAGEYDANLGDICVKREYQPAPDKVSVALY
ncbi:MAG TPA: hypothetical protein VEZ11_06415, partial [Thermoanaerobaculia bacterium]|nr:hypothetical protein [Thermoanaerobaculia bacterium]